MTDTRTWKTYFGKIAVPALILVTLTFALWPVEARGVLGNNAEAQACNRKLSQLAQAARQGRPATATFSERELNAHLARLLENNPQARQASGLTVGIDDLRLTTTTEQELTLYLRGRVLRVPFQVELRMEECGLERSCSGACDGVRVGRLPLVQPIKALALKRMQALIAGLRQEGVVLRHLHELEIRDGAVQVSVEG